MALSTVCTTVCLEKGYDRSEREHEHSFHVIMCSIHIHVRTLTLPAQSMRLTGGIRQTHVLVWTRCVGQFILEHDETSLSSTHDCKYGSGAGLCHYS